MDEEFANKIRATGAVYISYKDFFYDGEYRFADRKSGRLLTLDGKHLSLFGAKSFERYLNKRYPLL